MKTLALIGCGNIGQEFAKILNDAKIKEVFLVDPVEENRRKTDKILSNHSSTVADIQQTLKADIIVEAAHPDVVKELFSNNEINDKKKSILVMSTAGLIDIPLDTLECTIQVPSGAIAGLDAIAAVKDQIKTLTLTTTKPVKGLQGAPYIEKNTIDLDNINQTEVIFQGSVKEVITHFPQNTNVACSLYLASRFPDIKVIVQVDPHTTTNSHAIECTGSFGKIYTKTDNVPSANPKTSALAIESGIHLLKKLLQ